MRSINKKAQAVTATDREHVRSLLEEGYSESDICEVANHSLEWVREARNPV